MNKKIALHIIFLFCCFFSAEALQIIAQDKVVQQSDSLHVDNSQITPRVFDNLKDKYSSSDFIYERTAQTSGWWTRFKRSISDFFRDLFNFETQADSDDFMDKLLNILGVLIILVVIYFIYKAIVNKEGHWVFGKSSDKNIIPVTDVETNIHQTDFRTLIEEAESKQQYRLAIRYYYLWLLKQLTYKEIIEYDVEKTNSDYQNEIASKDISKKFAYTSYLYNYIWYGEFNIDDKQFRKAKNAFTNFLKTVKA